MFLSGAFVSAQARAAALARADPDLECPICFQEVRALIARAKAAGVTRLGVLYPKRAPLSAAMADFAAQEARAEGLELVHSEDYDPDHADFTTFALALGPVASPDELLARLEPVIARHDILRVKGFAEVAGKDMRLVVQGVGARLQHYYDRDWREGEHRRSQLVVIGEKGMDEAGIRAALAGSAAG